MTKIAIYKKLESSCISKKESEKLKKSHLGQIQVQFDTGFLSCRSTHYEPKSHNCHNELPCYYSTHLHCIVYDQRFRLFLIHCLVLPPLFVGVLCLVIVLLFITSCPSSVVIYYFMSFKC